MGHSSATRSRLGFSSFTIRCNIALQYMGPFCKNSEHNLTAISRNILIGCSQGNRAKRGALLSRAITRESQQLWQSALFLGEQAHLHQRPFPLLGSTPPRTQVAFSRPYHEPSNLSRLPTQDVPHAVVGIHCDLSVKAKISKLAGCI